MFWTKPLRSVCPMGFDWWVGVDAKRTGRLVMIETSMVGCTAGVRRACMGPSGGCWVDDNGFCKLWDHTTPGTRRPRVFGENGLDLHTIGHEVSLMAGEKRTSGNRLTLIMWPRWQTGHSRSERPVSLSYRSR